MNHEPGSPSLLPALRQLRAAFWRQRVAHWSIRALWLALLVPTLVMVGSLWLGWQIPPNDWLPAMLLVGLSPLLWSLRPISLKKMVHRLDRQLGLRARLITAFEIDSLPQASAQTDNPVTRRLLQETVNTTLILRPQVRSFGRSFWLEWLVLITVVTLLGTLLWLNALTPPRPNAAAIGRPPAWSNPHQADQPTPPPSPLSPSSMLTTQPGLDQAQPALAVLAEVLRDPAITRSIAEALNRGDLTGAAEELDRLADRLDDLSETASLELSKAMQEAAQAIGRKAPEFTGPLQTGSQALSKNDLSAARQALKSLADALEAAKGSVPARPFATPTSSEQPGPPPQAGQSSEFGAGEDESTEAERLAVEGYPLEIESDPNWVEPVSPPAAGAEEKHLFARVPLNTTSRDLGPDWLTYPWEKREIIRRYFTP